MSAKRKFNIIDIIILIIAVAVILAVAILLFGKKDTATKGTQYSRTIIVEVLQRDESFCSLPKEGDKLFDVTTKKEVGTLKAKEITPAMTNTTSMEEGRILKTAVPDKYDMRLTVEVTNPEIVSNIGANLSIHSKMYVVSGHVVDIADNGEAVK